MLKTTTPQRDPKALHPRAPAERGRQILFACAVALTSVAGFALAAGGVLRWIAIVVGVLTLASILIWALFRTRIPAGFTSVELPVLLLLLSTETLRQRDVTELAANPLDPAGIFRLICIGAALILGALTLTGGVRTHDIRRVTTRPFRLYCVYVLVVFLGVFTSVDPKLTAFHGVDLVAGIACIAGAYSVAGRGSTDRLLRVFYWWTVAEVASVWLGVLAIPSQAIDHVDSPLPWQLNGVFPGISSNGVGTIGAIVAIWSLALLMSPKESPGRKRLVTGTVVMLGLITLLFGQYRTGYVAAILAFLVLLALRKRMMTAGLFAVCVTVAWLWGATIIQHAAPLALRGQSIESASELSGRLGFWSAAIPVWKESPLIGRGLLTATRFEVLNSLGQGAISTIHNTWVEALVGTGVIGLTLLVASFLVLFARAAKEAVNRRGRIVPVLLLILIAVRSFTGTTIEQMGGGILFMILALSFRDDTVDLASTDRPPTVTRSQT
jgi:hypothetical protein